MSTVAALLLAAVFACSGKVRTARTMDGQALWLALTGASGFGSMWASLLAGRIG